MDGDECSSQQWRRALSCYRGTLRAGEVILFLSGCGRPVKNDLNILCIFSTLLQNEWKLESIFHSREKPSSDSRMDDHEKNWLGEAESGREINTFTTAGKSR